MESTGKRRRRGRGLVFASASVGLSAMGLVGCGGGGIRTPCTPDAGSPGPDESCYCPPGLVGPNACFVQYGVTSGTGGAGTSSTTGGGSGSAGTGGSSTGGGLADAG